MSFFQLVRREMQGSLTRLAVMSGLGGVSNAAILAAINAGATTLYGLSFGIEGAAARALNFTEASASRSGASMAPSTRPRTRVD